MSSVVVIFTTLPSAKIMSRSFFIPALSDFADAFSFTTAPLRTTKPSEVTIPVADVLPMLMNNSSPSLREITWFIDIRGKI